MYVRNLPYKITAEEMYDIFGKYGAIRQIRVGNTPETRGTAFVVYEDIFDAKNACDHLSGKEPFLCEIVKSSTNSPTHQITNLKCCLKSLLKPLFNGVLFLIYYFKKHFEPCFF